MTYDDVKTLKLDRPGSRKETWWAVVPKDCPESGAPPVHLVVGLVTKYHNTRTEKHPYKIYSGVGEAAEFRAALYGVTLPGAVRHLVGLLNS